MNLIRGQAVQTKESLNEQRTEHGDPIMMCENCKHWDYGDCDQTGYYMSPDDWCWRWKENCRDYLIRN